MPETPSTGPWLTFALVCFLAVPGAEEEIAPQPLEGAVRWTLHLHGDLARPGGG